MKRRPIHNPRSVESLLAVLETLRHAPEGPALLARIDQGRTVRGALLAVVERAFLDFLHSAMIRYERRAGTDPTTRLKAKLIARRAAALAVTQYPAEAGPAASLPSLQDAAALEQHLVAMLWSASEAGAREAQLGAHESQRGDPASAPLPSQDATLRVLTQTLAQQLDTASTHSVENLSHIKTVAASLERSHNARELDEFRNILRDTVQELLENNQTLDNLLRQAHNNARQLSFKTVAPTNPEQLSQDRQTLLRRLEAEARRAQRHRHPLSLALLGPDHLEDIDRLIGPHIGHEIIRQYLESVTSCARAYDVVAPCHPYGLVWLLPDTESTQGLQALRKVRLHVAERQYQYGGHLRPLPTFSGAVIRYSIGESPAEFLARAEALATRARHAGPGRIECEK